MLFVVMIAQPQARLRAGGVQRVREAWRVPTMNTALLGAAALVVSVYGITELIENNKIFDDLGVPTINPAEDRVMICGSPAMLRDLKHLLEARGFKEGNTSTPGAFVVERAFAEQ